MEGRRDDIPFLQSNVVHRKFEVDRVDISDNPKETAKLLNHKDSDNKLILQNSNSKDLKLQIDVNGNNEDLSRRRSFSVVPVNDLRHSPNSNLEHSFKHRLDSRTISEVDNEATEKLLRNDIKFNGHRERGNSCSSLKNLFIEAPNTSDTDVEKRSERSSDFEDDIHTVNRLRKSPIPINVIRSSSASQSQSSRGTSRPSSPNINKDPLCNRKISEAATIFPRVEPELHPSLPLHYMTISSIIRDPHTKCQYLTVQPARSRLTSPLETLSGNFVTSHEDGSKSIDLGSTDGRNIRFSGKAVLSHENVQTTVSDVGTLHTTSPGGECGSPGFAYPFVINKPEDDPLSPKEEDSTIDGEAGRPTWGSKLKFVLACIGSCVGLGNFWRFPYLCYKSGGGAFLIPYTIMLFLCGIPLLLMEMALGQYTRNGPIGALYSVCPLSIGSGVGVVMISVIFCSYYNVIIAWSIFYMIQSFKPVLPWTECNNSTGCTAGIPPTQYYFDNVVLQKTEGISDFGHIVLPLLGCVLLAWLVVYFAIWKSVRSSGMVVLVTATAPYVFILVFLLRAVSLDGAGEGLKYLFYPNWALLLDVNVWVSAAAQNFNSIGIGFGSMITFASYNKFSNNILLDVWVIGLVNAGTSLLAGIIVFSTIGNIALEQGRNITDVVSEGPGLAFVVYPQALAKMPYPNVFSVLFFLMLIILGIDSQFATVEVIVTSLKDSFPNWINKYIKHHELLALLVCIFCFIIGIPNLFQGGIYYFNLIDYYSAAISLMYLAFFEVAGVVWCYGANKLARNIREMTGKLPSNYFIYCWYTVSPLLIVVIAVCSWVDYQEPTYNNGAYKYPPWAIGIGWLAALASLVPIPIAAVYVLFTQPGDTIKEKFKSAIKARIEECPKCKRSAHNPYYPCRCHAVVTHHDLPLAAFDVPLAAIENGKKLPGPAITMDGGGGKTHASEDGNSGSAPRQV